MSNMQTASEEDLYQNGSPSLSFEAVKKKPSKRTLDTDESVYQNQSSPSPTLKRANSSRTRITAATPAAAPAAAAAATNTDESLYQNSSPTVSRRMARTMPITPSAVTPTAPTASSGPGKSQTLSPMRDRELERLRRKLDRQRQKNDDDASSDDSSEEEVVHKSVSTPAASEATNIINNNDNNNRNKNSHDGDVDESDSNNDADHNPTPLSKVPAMRAPAPATRGRKPIGSRSPRPVSEYKPLPKELRQYFEPTLNDGESED
jgi:hypothetical protein